MNCKSLLRRGLALTLTVLLTAGLAAPALAAGPSAPTCDETYYATLDYYGGLLDSSVVKTYATYGNSQLVDYGAYDEVVNLTDGSLPIQDAGKVTFDFPAGAPNKFYFEGKTAQPYEDFPWKLSLRYTLNGVPTLAEDLAGKTGVVEVTLDALPNPAASTYSRNNLVLVAASLFNGDDILSLEAPGAQIQLIGNLYCVLYAVLPGEEQHFTLRVGSEDFSYGGMVFLAVPATLEQLSQVADLRELKEDVEDSYDRMDNSLDILLDSLEGMSGHLNATADGLDLLNSARGTVSAGKGSVYASTDAALGSLDGLVNALGALDTYQTTLHQSVTDLNGALNDLHGAAMSLQPTLTGTQTTVTALQKDLKDLQKFLSDTEKYPDKGAQIAGNLEKVLDDMDADLDDLIRAMNRLEDALRRTEGLDLLTNSDLLGLLTKEEAAQMKTVLAAHDQYHQYLKDNNQTEKDLSFKNFILLGGFQTAYETQVTETVKTKIGEAYQQYCAATTAAGGTPMSAEEFAQTEQAQQIAAAVRQQAQAGFMDAFQAFLADEDSHQAEFAQAQAASDAYDKFTAQMPLVDTVNGKIQEINGLITDITLPTARLIARLSELCEGVEDAGLTGELASLSRLCQDLMLTLKSHEGEGAALLEDLNGAGDLVSQAAAAADGALAGLDELNGILNTYEPTVQSAITDVGTLSAAAQTALRDASAALGSAKELLQKVGPTLDEGTRQSLTGLSSSLRKATDGLDQTGALRDSKNAITDLVEEQWDSHTGQDNNLLLMDPEAPPQSLTDSRNQNVTSIQYVMRTQEIKVSQAEKEAEEAAQAEPELTLWDRIAAMFRDLWNAITGLFGNHS